MHGLFERIGLKSNWLREPAFALLGLIIGAALMPLLIFYAGATLLGRYEGASLGRLYASVFHGLRDASLAAWTLLLAPYGLYLLYKGLRAWWRAGSKFP